jgi:hypothetical protein
MPELRFTETVLNLKPEELERFPGATFCLHLAIHADKAVEQPVLHIECDGPFLKALSHARKDSPPMQGFKRNVYTVSYGRGGSLDAGEEVQMNFYAKQEIHVRRVIEGGPAPMPMQGSGV